MAAVNVRYEVTKNVKIELWYAVSNILLSGGDWSCDITVILHHFHTMLAGAFLNLTQGHYCLASQMKVRWL